MQRARSSSCGCADRPGGMRAGTVRAPNPPPGAVRAGDRPRAPRRRGIAGARPGTMGSARYAPRPPARRWAPPPRRREPPDPARSHGMTDGKASSHALRIDGGQLVQPPADLLEGLEDVGASTVLRALEALADCLVVE